MQLFDKNRIVNILASLVMMMLVLIQMIKSADHPFVYSFFTWLTWPTLFFVVGHYMANQELRATIVNGVKYYLLPYGIVGLIIIILNKLIRGLDLTKWLNTPFPSMKLGAVTMLYGNGWPTDTLIGHIDFGIGLLWLLLALFFGTILHALIIKLKPTAIRVIVSLLVMILGYYLGTFIQLPWSLDAAMVMQPYLLLGHYFKDIKLESINKPVTISVGLLSIWVMAITSGPFELTLASIRYWIFGTITALLGVIMMFIGASYLDRWLPKNWYQWFTKIGSGQSINITLLAFISLMIPISKYVDHVLSVPYVNFIIVWLIVFTIVVLLKLVIRRFWHYLIARFQKERT